MTILIIVSFVLTLVLGLVTILRRSKRLIDKHEFAFEYRDKFVGLANRYFSTYEKYVQNGTVDRELYIWLTKNVNQIQSDLGHTGTMHYVGAFQRFQIPNYQVVINTLPKFRDGSVESFDVTSTEDCLIRYIGDLEIDIKALKKQIKNPVTWFKEGFQVIISIPLYMLNWFGILGDRTFYRVMGSVIYKFITGVCGLVAFLSGVVTIIQGKDATITLFKQIFGL
jgi:hypothetical protein